MKQRFSRDFDIVSLSAYDRKLGLLAIADLHIGVEEALSKDGVLVPRVLFKKIKEELQTIFSSIDGSAAKIKTIVIDGDLKHEFGTISDQEWRETVGVLDILAEHAKEIILIKGNHDTILEPIAKYQKLKILDSYSEGGALFIHGDNLPEDKLLKGIDTIVIGHEHPAVSLSDGLTSEKFKCFLSGSYKGRELIVLPSMNMISEGSDILSEGPLSPMLEDMGDFEVFIPTDDEVLYFGRARDLV